MLRGLNPKLTTSIHIFLTKQLILLMVNTEALLQNSYKLALSVYYSDELSDDERNNLVVQLNNAMQNLPLEHKTKWIDRLVEEMLEYGACMDKEDGLDHITKKWIPHIGIVIS